MFKEFGLFRYILTALLLGTGLVPLPAYALKTDADGWYIDREPVTSGDFIREQDIKMEIHQHINQCLHLFGSRRVAELKNEFGSKLFISFFDPARDATRITFGSKSEVQKHIALTQRGGLEIVLYGRNAQKHPRIQGLFQYDHVWRAVFVPALAMSNPWFCGIFLHELSHASDDRRRVTEKKPSGAFPDPTWVDEEIRAHELERGILNVFTNGRYVPALIANITKKEAVSDLDSLFPSAPEAERRLRNAQFLIDSTLLLIEKKGGSVEEKRKAYIHLYDANRR